MVYSSLKLIRVEEMEQMVKTEITVEIILYVVIKVKIREKADMEDIQEIILLIIL